MNNSEKSYYEKNKEDRLFYQHSYYEENKKKIMEKRKGSAKRKEYNKIYMREYRRKLKEAETKKQNWKGEAK